jgi:Family of unknown function (DUF5908)
MPIEIRELIIKATVTADAESSSAQAGSTGAAAGSAEMVQLCVEKVLQILKEKNER